MRATVLLCLLHAAFGQNYNWDGPVDSTPPYVDSKPNQVCLLDQASCGCCLMQTQMKRMKWFFNMTYEAMNQELTKSKQSIYNMRASRSAFSVALNNMKSMSCSGPVNTDSIIIYNHIFINLGDGYNAQTGIFTTPRSGVYSLAVTIYATNDPNSALVVCANLQVNNQIVAELYQKNGNDLEDSASAVVVMKLQTGDKVSVSLPQNCFVCDNDRHYNTFTGFLLYATD